MNELVDSKEIFKCEYCKAVYKRKSAWLKHKCTQTKRLALKDTEAFSLALDCWSMFRNSQFFYKKRKIEDSVQFIQTREFKLFYALGEFLVKIKPVNSDQYVKWLLDSKISPKKWCNDRTYEEWLSFFIKNEDPLKAVSRSLDYIVERCNSAKFDVANYFSEEDPGWILFRLQTGHLSPWFILASTKAHLFLKRLDEEQTNVLEKVMNVYYWDIRVKRNQDTFESVCQLLAGAGL